MDLATAIGLVLGIGTLSRLRKQHDVHPPIEPSVLFVGVGH
jgi:hypothetical protein